MGNKNLGKQGILTIIEDELLELTMKDESNVSLNDVLCVKSFVRKLSEPVWVIGLYPESHISVLSINKIFLVKCSQRAFFTDKKNKLQCPALYYEL